MTRKFPDVDLSMDDDGDTPGREHVSNKHYLLPTTDDEAENHEYHPIPEHNTVDLEDDDEDDDYYDIAEFYTGNMPIRTPPLPENVTSLHGLQTRRSSRDLNSLIINETEYHVGECVELVHPQGVQRAGDFLRIHHITKDWYETRYKLRGLLMRRQSRSNGFLDARLNELYMVLQTHPGSHGSDFERGLVEIQSSQVLCKRDIILTNVQVAPFGNPYPDLSFRGERMSHGETKKDVQNNRSLVCRWASVISATKNQLARGRAQLESIRRLQEDELRALKAHIPGNIKICEDYLLYNQWRGFQHSPTDGRHTTVDCFCASGQVSEAFSEAGFRILCGVDNCPDAMRTYKQNRSRDTICLNCDIFDFAGLAEAYICDHLHTSFVCKTHSTLHTRPGKDDDANEATLFSTDVLVRKTRPRIVTVENVKGLATNNKEKMMLQKAINALTSLNYSVTWSSIDMRDYGLAARRPRIIIMASCPGTAPPTFPKPTHGPARSGLLPFNTIGNVLASIPPEASHQGPKYSRPLNKKSYDCFRSINCITTNGGDPGVNYHPDGNRSLNVRELASLNGFRWDFILPETCKKAVDMIGNAVPRTAFRPFADKIKRYLQKQDKWLAGEAARVHHID